MKELVSEAEIYFYKAIDTYIDNNTFSTYLNKVLDNNLTNYISRYNNIKNKVLNESVSYEDNDEILITGCFVEELAHHFWFIDDEIEVKHKVFEILKHIYPEIELDYILKGMK